MTTKLIYLFIIIYLCLFHSMIISQDRRIEAGIDEKLGDFLPVESVFTTSDGDSVSLGNIINKPTLLALVYYECPGVCAPLLTELAWVIEKINLIPGEDFQVISLSFDHHEGTTISSKWKKNYFKGMKTTFPEEAWIFLTGDSLNIKKVTDAAGFYFIPNEEDFIHAAALITISPKGKISRYVFGLEYNQFDLKMALLEADAGKTSPTISKMLQFCYSYDPDGRKYTLNVTRIIGSIMLIVVGIFFGFLTLKKKKSQE